MTLLKVKLSAFLRLNHVENGHHGGSRAGGLELNDYLVKG